MDKIKLDKMNQKVLARALKDIYEQIKDEPQGWAVEYLLTAASILERYDADDADLNDRFTILHIKFSKDKPSYDPDLDNHFCSGCGESGACYCTSNEDE